MLKTLHFSAALRRALTGARWGIAVGAPFAVWALFLWLVWGSGPFDEYNVGVLTVVGTYLGGGAVGGIIVGLLFPLTRWRATSLVLGVISFFPVAVAIMGSMEGFRPWTPDHTLTVILVSLALGSVVGWQLHGIDEGDES